MQTCLKMSVTFNGNTLSSGLKCTIRKTAKDDATSGLLACQKVLRVALPRPSLENWLIDLFGLEKL